MCKLRGNDIYDREVKRHRVLSPIPIAKFPMWLDMKCQAVNRAICVQERPSIDLSFVQNGYVANPYPDKIRYRIDMVMEAYGIIPFLALELCTICFLTFGILRLINCWQVMNT